MALPTAIKKQKGSYNKSRASLKNEIAPIDVIVSAPPFPDTLGLIGQREWTKVYKFLSDHEMSDAVDMVMIEMYCIEIETYITYKEQIKKDGATVMTPSGFPGLHPLTVAASQAFKNAKSMAVEFGFTANARGKMNVVKPKKQESKMAILKGRIDAKKVM